MAAPRYTPIADVDDPYYASVDPLLQIRSVEDARAYLDDVLALASAEEAERIVANAFQVSLRELRGQAQSTPDRSSDSDSCRRRQQQQHTAARTLARTAQAEPPWGVGGASRGVQKPAPRRAQRGGANAQAAQARATADAVQDAHDWRVYQLLGAADACHDFTSEELSPAALLAPGLFGAVVLPAEVPEEVLADEPTFARTVAAHSHLTFGPERVVNPLYRVRLLEEPAQASPARLGADAMANAVQRARAANNLGAALIPLEICTRVVDVPAPAPAPARAPRRSVEVMKLEQVAQVIGVLRARLGPDAELVVDAQWNSLRQLVLALDHLTTAFYRKFATEPAFDDAEGGRSARLERVRCYLRENGAAAADWRAPVVDANVFDPATDPAVAQHGTDPRPTGPVFRAECAYQVTLGGLEADGAAVVTVRDGRIGGQTVRVRSANAAASVSRTKLADLVRSRVAPTLYRQSDLARIVDAVEPGTALALKRAGDWGQVEHCVRYGKVFVTSDLLAALYAAYRGVRFIFMGFEKAEGRGGEEGDEMFRYRIVLKWQQGPGPMTGGLGISR